MNDVAKDLRDMESLNFFYQIDFCCSDEGKAAFQCIIEFMKECPELMSGSGGSDNPMAALGQIPGFDMNEFLQEGAMDATCALFVGKY
jgi:hypothetical protein